MYIDTTDVQNISTVGLDDQRSFIIECEFISGSDAQGCLVVLVGELDNITTILTRTRTNNVGTVEVAHSPSPYFKVLAFDVEQDGLIGTVAIQGDIIVVKRENKGLCVMINYIMLRYQCVCKMQESPHMCLHLTLHNVSSCINTVFTCTFRSNPKRF